MKKLLLYFLTLIMIVTSCDNVELEEVDPNNFADATPDLLIKAPFIAMDLVVEGELARLANMWTSQFTGADRQYISYNVYNVVAGDFDNIWGTLYADGIAQCRVIQEKAAILNNNELIALSLVVEANLLGTAAALFENVPNVEAGDVITYPQPKFDTQLSVYQSVIAKLDQAITLFNGLTTVRNYAADVIDPSITALNWVEVANSLKARYYLHMGDYVNAIASANLGISSSAGDFLFHHPGGSYPNNLAGAQNIYFDFCSWNRDGYMGAGGAHLVHLMNAPSVDFPLGRDDARLDYYYFSPGVWNNDWYPNSWSAGTEEWFTTDGIFDAGVSFPIITYYETQLIIAECELIDGSPNSVVALAALNNVRAYWDGFIGLGVFPSLAGSFPPYLAADFATDADLLMEILIEKYTSCYGQIEAFNDMRRTDNYIGIPIKAGTQLPQRFLIPQSELNSNVNAKVIDIFVVTEANKGTYPGV